MREMLTDWRRRLRELLIAHNLWKNEIQAKAKKALVGCEHELISFLLASLFDKILGFRNALVIFVLLVIFHRNSTGGQ